MRPKKSYIFFRLTINVQKTCWPRDSVRNMSVKKTSGFDPKAIWIRRFVWFLTGIRTHGRSAILTETDVDANRDIIWKITIDSCASVCITLIKRKTYIILKDCLQKSKTFELYGVHVQVSNKCPYDHLWIKMSSHTGCDRVVYYGIIS